MCGVRFNLRQIANLKSNPPDLSGNRPCGYWAPSYREVVRSGLRQEFANVPSLPWREMRSVIPEPKRALLCSATVFTSFFFTDLSKLENLGELP